MIDLFKQYKIPEYRQQEIYSLLETIPDKVYNELSKNDVLRYIIDYCQLDSKETTILWLIVNHAYNRDNN